jgi:hypothetical protein
MVANSDLRHPATLEGGIGPAVADAEGVALGDLEVGAKLEIQTAGRIYRMENLGDGKVVVSGHPEYCPEPVEVDLLGSSGGVGLIRMRYIGIGMRMEFEHPTRGRVRTSRVKAIRLLSPAAETQLLAC